MDLVSVLSPCPPVADPEFTVAGVGGEVSGAQVSQDTWLLAQFQRILGLFHFLPAMGRVTSLTAGLRSSPGGQQGLLDEEGNADLGH